MFKVVNFNKPFSQQIARWMIWILPLFICISLVHEFIYRDMFYDSCEDRYWCIIEYGSLISSYTTFILTFHTLVPFSINILSTIYIIIGSIRRRVRVRNEQSYNRNVRAQLKEHRHLIISPLILAALSSPRVILSLFSACVRTYRDPWLYLIELLHFISTFSGCIHRVCYAISFIQRTARKICSIFAKMDTTKNESHLSTFVTERGF